MLNATARICPATRGLLHSNRIKIDLPAEPRHRQLDRIADIATDLFESAHSVFSNHTGNCCITKGFAHLFCLIFSFEPLSEDEVYERLIHEVRKKYKE